MKIENKKRGILSISLVAALMLQTLNAGRHDLSGSVEITGGSQWKDERTGLNYYSGGVSTFKFKPKTRNFAPWFKGKPPGIKAGCGGISLDGGFVAFMDLDKIQEQLESAMQAVGMGVIVVLVQTLPSIGKAFEQIQTLVRKIQQMLQNACSLTTQALGDNPALKDMKNSVNSWAKDVGGDDVTFGAAEGLSTIIDDIATTIKCRVGDVVCEKKKDSLFMKAVNKPKNDSLVNFGVPLDLTNGIASKTNLIPYRTKVQTSPLKDVFDSNEFNGVSLAISSIQKTQLLLQSALFGRLVIQEGTGLDKIEDILKKAGNEISDDEAIVQATFLEDGYLLSNLKLVFIKPSERADDAISFLTGEDSNSTNPSKAKIPAMNLNVKKSCSKTVDASGDCTGSWELLIYYTDSTNTDKDIELEWEGLYESSKTSILHALDSSTYNAPINEASIYIPNGAIRLDQIREYAREEDKLYYADLLARANVVFAVRKLVSSARAEIYELSGGNSDNEEVINKYINNAEKVIKEIEEGIEQFPGDFEEIVRINQVFGEMVRVGRQAQQQKALKK